GGRPRAGVDRLSMRGLRRRRFGTRGAQLLLEAERIGLIDPAAERDHGVLHSAFFPISRRYCIPSNEICSTPAYARAIATARVLPRPTTVSTRPPAVTRLSSRRVVPA